MRLNAYQVAAIQNAAKHHFGEDAEIWLFGSRVDDQRRGGDIDLYIETDREDPEDISRRQIKFLAALYMQIGEQKIDVLVKSRTKEEALPIYRIAREEGVRL
jgi:predicted nucleotidyltransferase